MTVREAFELAFGPLPEGAACHLLSWAGNGHCAAVTVREWHGHKMDLNGYWVLVWSKEMWVNTLCDVWCPDISDRPAEAFLGFFGEAYDRVVQEDTKNP